MVINHLLTGMILQVGNDGSSWRLVVSKIVFEMFARKFGEIIQFDDIFLCWLETT